MRILETKKKLVIFEYLPLAAISVFFGFLISVYSYSVIVLLLIVLFIFLSFAFFEKIILLLILYIPFQVALNISNGIDLSSARVLIIYIFFVWIVKSLAERKFIIKFNLQMIFIFLFLFVSALSFFWGLESERALRKILFLFSIFPLYFIITSIDANKKYIFAVLKVLILGAVAISAIGVVQFFSQFIFGVDSVMDFWKEYISVIFYGKTFGAQVVSNPSWLVNISGVTVMRAFSIFPDPHMFSFYLGLLIPIVLAIAVSVKRGNVYFLSALSIMILAEFLTFSRAGYIGMFFGIGVTVILLRGFIKLPKIFLPISFLFVVFLFIFISNQYFITRLLSTFDFSEGSNIERIKNWKQGLNLVENNLFFGVGIGNYSANIDPLADYRVPIYAHNLYIDIAAETGILSLILWLALIFAIIYQMLTMLNIKNNNSGDIIFSKAVPAGIIGSLIWFSTHSFFDTSIYSPTVLSILVVIISLSVLIQLKVESNRHT